MTDQSPAIEELILFAEHLCLGIGEKQLLKLLAKGWPISPNLDTIRGAIEYILLRGPSVEHEIETIYNDLYEIADKLSLSTKQKVMYRSLTDTKWVDLGTMTSLNDALDWNIEPPKLR